MRLTVTVSGRTSAPGVGNRPAGSVVARWTGRPRRARPAAMRAAMAGLADAALAGDEGDARPRSGEVVDQLVDAGERGTGGVMRLGGRG